MNFRNFISNWVNYFDKIVFHERIRSYTVRQSSICHLQLVIDLLFWCLPRREATRVKIDSIKWREQYQKLFLVAIFLFFPSKEFSMQFSIGRKNFRIWKNLFKQRMYTHVQKVSSTLLFTSMLNFMRTNAV